MPAMKTFVVTERTVLREGSKLTAPAKLQLEIGDRLSATGQTADGFDEVVFTTRAGKKHTGWVLQAHREEAEPEAPEDFDAEGFVEICIVAQRAINNDPSTAPWFVAADLVIARALLETKLANLGPLRAGSDAVGPLQVSSVEWDKFLRCGRPFAQTFREPMRDDPIQQIWGATYRMHTDAKAITDFKVQQGMGPAIDPPLPSYLEVFLAYLTNSVEAAIKLADAAASEDDKDKDLPALLAGVLGPAEITALRDAVVRISGKPAADKALAFTADIETALNGALMEAFERIMKFAPAGLITAGGKPPWFEVAKKETGIAEPNERILDYFKSIKFATDTTKTPWCAAFVSFCMKDSGDAKAANSVPASGPALAATWRNWGEALPLSGDSTPPGAVVVLKPTEKGDGSGHVGFFVRGDSGSVTLLGGNQKDSVRESTYQRSRVVAIRWLDVGNVAPLAGAGANLKLERITSAERRKMAQLIVEKFARAGYGAFQQIAAVANAMGESGLDPRKRNTTAREDSVGLFQLNMRGGVGAGHSPEELQEPERNIALIIAEANRRSPSFRTATSLEAAVRAFVRDVERPKNAEADSVKRIEIARKLVA